MNPFPARRRKFRCTVFLPFLMAPSAWHRTTVHMARNGVVIVAGGNEQVIKFIPE
ncbi:hypothetical protein [Acidovorax sp. SUPP2825]|uniref:hypothetical protein n=1 Tax=Acidovorax sp. SUPP2825 TaxID=2920879 RepID=UPI0024E116F5|nr:hypothetical protein [Acidovorax sp. SUPP2825]